jgi:hypothetical protein
MGLVKNDFVEMDWNASWFLQGKKAGFILAIEEYNGVGVAFQDNVAYVMFDDNNKLETGNSLIKMAQAEMKAKNPDFPEYMDGYEMVADGGGVCANEELLETIGLSEENLDDIEKRLEDLSCYWGIETTEVPD